MVANPSLLESLSSKLQAQNRRVPKDIWATSAGWLNRHRLSLATCEGEGLRYTGARQAEFEKRLSEMSVPARPVPAEFLVEPQFGKLLPNDAPISQEQREEHLPFYTRFLQSQIDIASGVASCQSVVTPAALDFFSQPRMFGAKLNHRSAACSAPIDKNARLVTFTHVYGWVPRGWEPCHGHDGYEVEVYGFDEASGTDGRSGLM